VYSSANLMLASHAISVVLAIVLLEAVAEPCVFFVVCIGEESCNKGFGGLFVAFGDVGVVGWFGGGQFSGMGYVLVSLEGR
jgi:hypothetical protein